MGTLAVRSRRGGCQYGVLTVKTGIMAELKKGFRENSEALGIKLVGMRGIVMFNPPLRRAQFSTPLRGVMFNAP